LFDLENTGRSLRVRGFLDAESNDYTGSTHARGGVRGPACIAATPYAAACVRA